MSTKPEPGTAAVSPSEDVLKSHNNNNSRAEWRASKNLEALVGVGKMINKKLESGGHLLSSSFESLSPKLHNIPKPEIVKRASSGWHSLFDHHSDRHSTRAEEEEPNNNNASHAGQDEDSSSPRHVSIEQPEEGDGGTTAGHKKGSPHNNKTEGNVSRRNKGKSISLIEGGTENVSCGNADDKRTKQNNMKRRTITPEWGSQKASLVFQELRKIKDFNKRTAEGSNGSNAHAGNDKNEHKKQKRKYRTLTRRHRGVGQKGVVIPTLLDKVLFHLELHVQKLDIECFADHLQPRALKQLKELQDILDCTIPSLSVLSFLSICLFSR